MTFSNILFNKIENGLIFTSDYRTFVKNNTISFSNAGIAVVYGPNGTGKTSLAKVLVEKKEQPSLVNIIRLYMKTEMIYFTL